jgi:enoyl-CoA hydratase/carnithine racemase
LVQWAVPRAELDARTREIAARVAALPAGALAWGKSCIAAAAGMGDGYRDELEGTRQLLTNPDTRQRVNAFVAEVGSQHGVGAETAGEVPWS